MNGSEWARAEVVRLERARSPALQLELARLAAVRPDLAARLVRAALRLREAERRADEADRP